MVKTMGLRAAFIGLVTLSSGALADDPRDPGMKTPEAVARDREQTRQLNLGVLAIVKERDRKYAKGRREDELAKSDPRYDRTAYEKRLVEYERSRARYAQDRERYEQGMAQWREDVAACRAGYRQACY